MKPTSGRLPMEGLVATGEGEEQIVPTIGPLATSLEGCKLFIKTIIEAKPWYKEPSLLPFPWREEDFFKDKKLKVAVLWDDGVVRPHPPVTRALKQLVSKLQGKLNIEIVEWKPYKHDLAWEIIVRSPLNPLGSKTDAEKANLYFSDGGAQEKEAIDSSGEPWRPLSQHIITKNPHVQHHTISSLWAATLRRDEYRTSYASVWNSTATSVGPHGVPEGMVDVILCPVGPGAAPRIDTSKWWGYTSHWNLLDYPALVFPVDRVDVVKDGEKETHEARNEWDRENWDLWEKYGAEGWEGAPVCLQLVGRRSVFLVLPPLLGKVKAHRE
jgi:amidase